MSSTYPTATTTPGATATSYYTTSTPGLTIQIEPVNEYASPAGKLCDASLHFGPAFGPLAGLKLAGFALWERRSATGRRNVTFPARVYSVNGERRSYALLRPASLDTYASRTDEQPGDAMRDAIVWAFEQFEMFNR